MSTPDTADPLQSLRELQERERELVDARRLLIARARLEGHSWSEIGAALDVSKQAAWQLFNDEVTAILDRVAKRKLRGLLPLVLRFDLRVQGCLRPVV